MTEGLTLLIVGGYGTFGGRTVELLEHDPRLTIVVAGRSLAKARAYCATRTAAKAKLVPAEFNRNGDVAAQLAAHRPNILLDASGPFQSYGKKPYALIEAAIAQGVHYLDLADGAEFVAGVAQFDEAARNAGVSVLSGVSSFPVLTAAAVRRLSAGMAHVDTIAGGIAPSPHARVGENVIRAIVGYSGKPIPLKRDGKIVTAYPLTEHVRFTIAPPGFVPLKRTMFSLVDVPDLRALSDLWPEAKTIWMGAGPVPLVLHRALSALAWLVRLRLFPTLSPFAPLVYFVIRHVHWGEHRGGSFVEVAGRDESGATVTRSWHLLAEGEDGPLIPSMAVAALVRNALEGKNPPAGARAATRELELEDYEPLFNGRQIVTGFREDVSPDAPLYERYLGDAWERLPEPIRDLHDVTTELHCDGRADVDRGRGPLANLVASIIGFPKAGRDLPVTVYFKVTKGTELWTRTFAGKSFSSLQFEGKGSYERLIFERFGPIDFAMALVLDGDHLRLVLRRWRFLRIPMPMFLCPRSNAFETVEDGRFRFHVEISLPLIGLVIRYRGWLVPR